MDNEIRVFSILKNLGSYWSVTEIWSAEPTTAGEIDVLATRDSSTGRKIF